jgi:riboflavin synthase
MFTGLIESLGTVASVDPIDKGVRLGVRTAVWSDLEIGESLAVNGVCLTVVSAADGFAYADVSPETMRVTTIGSLPVDALLNLERSLRADARLGGHFVQGHVDGTGEILQILPDGDGYRVTVRFPQELSRFIVHKGSIAIDGISLTVAGLDADRLDVQIIPYTWEHTNLKAAAPGTRVNLECDILGKYIARALEQRGL